jgi:hypothetical protein
MDKASAIGNELLTPMGKKSFRSRKSIAPQTRLSLQCSCPRALPLSHKTSANLFPS